MADTRLWNPVMDRRDALKMGAAGAAALAGLGTVQQALGQCIANPAQTQGPYWVDEMLSRSDIRSDPTSGVVQPGSACTPTSRPRGRLASASCAASR